jgi:peptidoglycan hydrolase-like protein with peptidoglycan-binding domain
MKNMDLKELYKLVPYGAVVKISHNAPIIRTLKNGDIGSDVLEIQKSLKKLGYFYGSCNGIFGENLKTVVVKFQKDHKIRQTGTITKQTRAIILDYDMIE